MSFFQLFSRKFSAKGTGAGMQHDSSSPHAKRDPEKRIRSLLDTIGRLEDRG